MTDDEKGSDCLGSMPRGSHGWSRNVDQGLCTARSYPTTTSYRAHSPVILHSTCTWAGLFDLAAPLSRVLAECLVSWTVVTITQARWLKMTEMHSGGQKWNRGVSRATLSLKILEENLCLLQASRDCWQSLVMFGL